MPTEATATGPVPRAHPDQPELGVAAAARRLGVAPATLRTWARRYGIGPTRHTPGQHRRYTARDLARLELMQHALVRGASAADAARIATSAELSEPEPAAALAVPPGSGPEAVEHPLQRAQVRVGGVALRLPDAGRRARGLARAALMLDPQPVRALLTESLAALGVQATWEEVVCPVLIAVADRWAHTGAGVEIEHQFSECVAAVFGRHAAAMGVARDARPVLLAGMPGEQHTLPMTVLSAALAESGVPSRAMGANLPMRSLVDAIRRIAPSVVVLWAQRPDTADLDAVAGLPGARPRFRTFVAGPGWPAHGLPARVGRLDSLGAARRTIAEMVPV